MLSLWDNTIPWCLMVAAVFALICVCADDAAVRVRLRHTEAMREQTEKRYEWALDRLDTLIETCNTSMNLTDAAQDRAERGLK